MRAQCALGKRSTRSFQAPHTVLGGFLCIQATASSMSSSGWWEKWSGLSHSLRRASAVAPWMVHGSPGQRSVPGTLTSVGATSHPTRRSVTSGCAWSGCCLLLTHPVTSGPPRGPVCGRCTNGSPCWQRASLKGKSLFSSSCYEIRNISWCFVPPPQGKERLGLASGNSGWLTRSSCGCSA